MAKIKTRYAWSILFIKDTDERTFFRLVCIVTDTSNENAAARLGYKELANKEKDTAMWAVGGMANCIIDKPDLSITKEMINSKSFQEQIDELKKLAG